VNLSFWRAHALISRSGSSVPEETTPYQRNRQTFPDKRFWFQSGSHEKV
jgi:hypothetical protein